MRDGCEAKSLAGGFMGKESRGGDEGGAPSWPARRHSHILFPRAASPLLHDCLLLHQHLPSASWEPQSSSLVIIHCTRPGEGGVGGGGGGGGG